LLDDLGRYDESLTSLDKLIELDPKEAGLWNTKGNTLSILGRYEEAIACYDKSLELVPTNKIVSNNRSKASGKLGSSHVDMSSINRNKIKYNTSDGKPVYI
jgi:tetratricopeptide (TPR) repeat protein